MNDEEPREAGLELPIIGSMRAVWSKGLNDDGAARIWLASWTPPVVLLSIGDYR